MADVKIKKSWIAIALVIIANIFIFSYFSKGLEKFVANQTIEQIESRNGL